MITREDMGYIDWQQHKNDGISPDRFVQCQSCAHFIPSEDGCTEMVEGAYIVAQGSCVAYSPGPNAVKADGYGKYQPEELDYVVRPVRCSNCSHLSPKGTTCLMFKLMNKRMPERFMLIEQVDKNSCCNLQEPKMKRGMFRIFVMS